ncbi:winged helix-turn-helix transcriptional regulator [Nonomuraea sediminis]|uniref:winged helix-turn-helix transcriptional regulator n=1 Tax=Nonomuraea sediminis TaxID=2835864 RepID=UPI001BDC4904|nr:winged helix-turn-helix transcriptional regulator [Nonomuraea sediminis]
MDQRSYNQFCATARTLDIIGERWTLLLVRELLTGPKRFGDLQKSLRGLGTGLLSARLKHLEREGLARRVTLPPPARTPAYELTEAGRELEPAVMALARWGTKWAMGERHEEESFHPGWAVLGMRSCFVPEAAAGLRAVYEFRVDDELFHVDVDDGRIDTVHGPAQRPDVVVEAGQDVLVGIAARRTTLAEALADGTARATGDARLLHALGELFVWPPAGDRTPDNSG